MSFPDAFTPDMVLGPDQVLPTVPRGFGERFDLEWKAARAPDKWYFFETRMRDLWDDALEKLHKATGQRFRNPYPADPLRRDDPFTDVLAAFDQARAGQFDLPDPRRFEDKIRDEATKLRQDAQRSALASYGAGGLGAFLGAASGELSHPVNLATLPAGASYATGNLARVGLLRFLGRNALTEAGVAAASQTAIEIADAPYQERLATDTGLEDRLERIFIAGAGGAILGMGLSGLVAAARGVRKRLNPTLDEADAIKVAERATLHEGKNPLGPEGGVAHERAAAKAEADVAAGRHADVREEVRFPDAAPAPVQPMRGDLWRATPEQLRKLLDDKNLSDREKLVRALGKEGADEFERLSRTAESSNPQRADAAAARLAEIENRLTPEQSRLVYGIGETDLQADEIKRLLDVHDHLKDSADEYVGWFATRGLRKVRADDILAVPNGNGSIDAQAAFVGMMRGWQELTARGMSNDAVTAAFVRGMVDVAGMSPHDAADFVGSFLERARGRAQPDAPTFDLLDSAAATRAIAAAAPVPPEKAAASAKAEVEISNARAIAETNAEAKAALEAADEEAKMANRIKNCAMGVAIG